MKVCVALWCGVVRRDAAGCGVGRRGAARCGWVRWGAAGCGGVRAHRVELDHRAEAEEGMLLLDIVADIAQPEWPEAGRVGDASEAASSSTRGGGWALSRLASTSWERQAAQYRPKPPDAPCGGASAELGRCQRRGAFRMRRRE